MHIKWDADNYLRRTSKFYKTDFADLTLKTFSGGIHVTLSKILRLKVISFFRMFTHPAPMRELELKSKSRKSRIGTGRATETLLMNHKGQSNFAVLPFPIFDNFSLIFARDWSIFTKIYYR